MERVGEDSFFFNGVGGGEGGRGVGVWNLETVGLIHPTNYRTFNYAKKIQLRSWLANYYALYYSLAR